MTTPLPVPLFAFTSESSAFTTGTLVYPGGTTRSLALEDVELDVTETWTSPRGGTYPAAWRLRVPSEDLDLRITPFLADQELDVSVRYWEGAVRIEGTAGGSPVSGSGYVELTGYADEAEPARRGSHATRPAWKASPTKGARKSGLRCTKGRALSPSAPDC